jgi:hypothetical protein
MDGVGFERSFGAGITMSEKEKSPAADTDPAHAWVEMRQRLANYNAVASAPCSRALGAQIGSKDYTEIPMPGRHVGLFVSSKSQGKLSQSIAGSLVARDASPVSEA